MDDPSEAYGPTRQREVYAAGMLADSRPDLPTSPDERQRASVTPWGRRGRSDAFSTTGSRLNTGGVEGPTGEDR